MPATYYIHMGLQWKVGNHTTLQVFSRSLKMVSIDRSYTTLYWFAVLTIALSGTIIELFDVQNIVTLKCRLGVIEGNWKRHHLIDRIRVSIRLPL